MLPAAFIYILRYLFLVLFLFGNIYSTIQPDLQLSLEAKQASERHRVRETERVCGEGGVQDMRAKLFKLKIVCLAEARDKYCRLGATRGNYDP